MLLDVAVRRMQDWLMESKVSRLHPDVPTLVLPNTATSSHTRPFSHGAAGNSDYTSSRNRFLPKHRRHRPNCSAPRGWQQYEGRVVCHLYGLHRTAPGSVGTGRP